VTLTGVGGCGKTRLALEVSRAVLDQYPDGVWLVELGPLADVALVPHSVAAVLGVRQAAGQTSISALTTRLRERRLLLVLDNCEHLLESCAALIDALLRACPDIRVLATSREPLRISGEIAWRVPSLAVPDPLHLPPLSELQRNPAVQLFVERARAVEPRFSLSDHSAAVAEVCARLDGIPLALELAAARVSVLPVSQLATRLDQRFRLLTGGSRAALPRQRTLRATLDWSYDLLSVPERQVFERLAVFSGGCSLEAAEAVCAGDAIEPQDVLDLLAQLVGKSLVVADVARDGTARYWLLETMREYARERLASAGTLRAVARRHAEYFLRFVAALDPDQPMRRSMVTLGSSSLLDLAEREQDNLRTALRWWIEIPDAEQAAQQAAGLFLIWFCRGSVAEGRAWLNELLALPLARATPDIQKRLLTMAGYLARRHGEYAAACKLFEELLAAHDAAGDGRGAAAALLELANVHQLRADYPAARAALEASRTRAGGFADVAYQATWLFIGGQIELHDGQYDAARNLLSEGLAHSERMASATGARPIEPLYKAYSLLCLAAVARQQGEDAEAGALLDQGRPVVLQYGDRPLLGMFFDGYAGLAAAVGQHERAMILEGAADALREAAGAPHGPAWQRMLQHWLQVTYEALSRDAAVAAWATGRAMPLDDAIALIQASSAQTTAATPGLDPLTPREREVAALIAQGLSNRQIAERLVITERTVAAHIEHILDKLSFSSRTQVGVWAAHHYPLESSPV